ncbi:MAG: RNA polymerase sigma factor [Planctomycetota bacterium]|jgi:RNA polymerase sigma-70 factor (ECF subfamily)
MTDRSDVELMLAVKAGDEGAFGELVSRHRDSIVNLTYRYLGNRADAEDLAQEVFLKVYRARMRYEPRAKFTTWLYRVAVNACLNEVRNRKLRPTFGAAALPGGEGDEDAFVPTLRDADAQSPAEGAAQAELRAQVRAAVDDLPERQRLALLLNKFHGLGYEELAATLEMTIPGVKSLLVRARENVRQRLEPYLRSGVDRWSRKRGTA